MEFVELVLLAADVLFPAEVLFEVLFVVVVPLLLEDELVAFAVLLELVFEEALLRL